MPSFSILVPALFASAVSEIAPVLVDDASIAGPAGWARSSLSRDFHCGAHGWKGDFLYSGSTGDSLDFHVELPQCGCYLIEEFHPTSCTEDLSQEVELDIHYCAGMQHKVTVDQSTGGNRWNPIAMLPFYGPKYNISVKSKNTERAVVDAFRYTWIGTADTCATRHAQGDLQKYASLAKLPDSVVVDDKAAVVSGTAITSFCSSSVQGGVHATKSHGSAQYSFEPPSTGCYRLEEFHPTASESCPLSGFSKLNVEYCLGGRHETHVDLGSRGSRWNTVSSYMFYAGVEGKVTASRASSGALWAADAFRFTKVGDSCRREARTVSASIHITGVELPGAELSNSIVSHASLRINLLATISSFTGLATEGIAMNLRHGSIIVDLTMMEQGSEFTEAVRKLEAGLTDSTSSLKTLLCSATGSAASACGVELMYPMEITPAKFSSKPNNEADHAATMQLIAGACGMVLFGSLALGIVMFLQRRRKSSSKVTSTNNQEKDPECGDIAVVGKGKSADDTSSVSGSTATPSDQGSLGDVPDDPLMTIVPSEAWSENSD